MLLGLLAGFTLVVVKVLDFANSNRILGISLVTVAMGFEEFIRWGGLLVSRPQA